MTFQFTDKPPNVDLGAIRQYIANGVTGNGLAIIAGQQITPGTIIGIVDRALHSAQCTNIIGIPLAACVL